MNYIKVNDDASTEYPYDLSKLRKDFPNTSFPQPYELADLTPFGVFAVVDTAPPVTVDGKEKAKEIDPILVGDVWTQQWEVKTNSQAEEAAAVSEIKNSFFVAMLQHEDATAQARGYYDRVHCATRAPNGTFKTDCGKFQDWTDACLAQLNSTFTAYASGTPLPTRTAFVASLPAMVW